MSDFDIAVVGMACRFPGAPDLDAFRRLLFEGKCGLRRLSTEEMLVDGIPRSDFEADDYVPIAGTLDDFDAFDESFFGFSPQDAAVLNPSQRITLETAYRALEHAGYETGESKENIGVFVGAAANGYIRNIYLEGAILAAVGDYSAHLLNDRDYHATLCGHRLNLTGPCLSVLTACSTSLVAVHLAAQALLAGECDAAVAGGASVRVPHRAGFRYRQGGIISPDGFCRAFDKNAQGCTPASGVGLVVLRRLDDAIASKDRIWAVIRGSAINNDGATKTGFTAPSATGQEAAIRAALTVSNLEPGDIDFLEAHGTGTVLGDAVEIDALNKVFAQHPRAAPLQIGSVKTNIGHTDAAAGIAGLIKTVLALDSGRIPPSLNYVNPNPQIASTNGQLEVTAREVPWARGARPRRAGISSFGIGGTNAHVVIEEPPQLTALHAQTRARLLLVSAPSECALKQLAGAVAQQSHNQAPETLDNLAFTLARGRRAHRHRKWIVQAPTELARTGSAAAIDNPRVLFLAAGQGTLYPGMGADLYRRCPQYRAAFEEIAEITRRYGGPDLIRVLGYNGGTATISDMLPSDIAQPAIFAVSMATARMLQSFGIRCNAAGGFSFGEFSAAVMAGLIDLETGAKLAVTRGRLCAEMPEGAMVSVALEGSELASLLPKDCWPAIRHQSGLTTVGGRPDAVNILRDTLEHRGIWFKDLAVNRAFHTPLMTDAALAFARELETVTFRQPTGHWHCTVRSATTDDFRTRLVRLVAEPIDLSPMLAAAMQTTDLALVVGPGSGLVQLASQASTEHVVPVCSILPGADGDEWTALLEAAGQAWSIGALSDASVLFPNGSARRIPTPALPLQRNRHFISAPAAVNLKDLPKSMEDPSSDCRLWERTWRRNSAQLITEEHEDVHFLIVGRSEFAKRAARALNPVSSRYHEMPSALEAMRDSGPMTLIDCRALDPGQPAELADRAQEMRTTFLRGVEELAGALEDRADATRYVVITRNLFDVIGQERLEAEMAFPMALYRCLEHECPAVGTRLIDLETRDALADNELAALLKAMEPSVSAMRAGHRWVPRVEPIQASIGAETNAVFRSGEICLITGGFGGLALGIAENLAKHCAATFVLMGPHLPAQEKNSQRCSDRLAAIDRLRDLGATVVIVQADVTDRQTLSRAVERVVHEVGPVTWLLHTAGVPGGSLARFHQAGSEVAVTAPKVEGTINILDACAGQPLEAAVLFSSNVAETGAAGQLDYTAGNGFMDAFAVACRRDGMPVVSVGWPAWRHDSWTQRLLASQSELRDMLAESRIRDGLSTDEGTAALISAAASGRAHVIVSKNDFRSAYRDALTHSRALISGAVLPVEAEAVAVVSPAGSKQIKTRLAAIWTEVLGHVKIEDESNFFELGGNSLSLIQVLSHIREEFGADLSLKDLFAAQELSAMATAILAAVGGVSAVDDPELAALVDEISNLPEDEVERLLVELEDKSL